MRKKPLLLLVGLGVVGGAVLLALKSYQVDLIQYVTVNAMLQKAPESSSDAINRTFQQALERAGSEGKSELYLKRLLEISQRLEKVQHLTQQDATQILADIEAFDQPVEDPDAEGQ